MGIAVPIEKQENWVTKDITCTTAVPIQKVHEIPETIVTTKPNLRPDYKDINITDTKKFYLG